MAAALLVLTERVTRLGMARGAGQDGSDRTGPGVTDTPAVKPRCLNGRLGTLNWARGGREHDLGLDWQAFQEA